MGQPEYTAARVLRDNHDVLRCILDFLHIRYPFYITEELPQLACVARVWRDLVVEGDQEWWGDRGYKWMGVLRSMMHVKTTAPQHCLQQGHPSSLEIVCCVVGTLEGEYKCEKGVLACGASEFSCSWRNGTWRMEDIAFIEPGGPATHAQPLYPDHNIGDIIMSMMQDVQVFVYVIDRVSGRRGRIDTSFDRVKGVPPTYLTARALFIMDELVATTPTQPEIAINISLVLESESTSSFSLRLPRAELCITGVAGDEQNAEMLSGLVMSALGH